MTSRQKSRQHCTIYIVRHGETEANIQNIVSGHYESSLTKRGINQAKKRGLAFKKIKFDAIYSSDLSRAIQTGQIIGYGRNLPIKTSPLLRERSYGQFEGKKESEYKKSIGHMLKTLKELTDKERWQFKIGNDIESDAELIARFRTKLKKIAQVHPRQNILVISHEACIRTFLISIGFAKFNELAPGIFQNCGYLKILCNGKNFTIKKIDGIKKISITVD